MTKHDNGGPAFPDPARASGHCMDTGMTMRDWFAGQALIGIINACAMDARVRGETSEMLFARKAYSVADAMIAAMEKCYD